MRILITGATGFAGGWLCEALLSRGGQELLGVSRQGSWPQTWQHLAGRLRLSACDLDDLAQLTALLRQFAPTQIYHLAGYPHVGRSFQEVEAAWAGNLVATRNLYEALLKWGGRPRLVAVTSGMVYGDALTLPGRVDEEAPLRPTSPYGASKAAADLVSYQYFRSHGLEVVRARPFNHIGPAQSPEFAVASFARQLAEIARGRRPAVLETGNLASTRDLADVRDVADAYVQLMERGQPGQAYNIASGHTVSIQEVLDRLIELAGLKVEVRQRTDRPGAADPSRVAVALDKIERDVGWRPQRSLLHTLTDTLDYWKAQS